MQQIKSSIGIRYAEQNNIGPFCYFFHFTKFDKAALSLFSLLLCGHPYWLAIVTVKTTSIIAAMVAAKIEAEKQGHVAKSSFDQVSIETSQVEVGKIEPGGGKRKME